MLFARGLSHQRLNSFLLSACMDLCSNQHPIWQSTVNKDDREIPWLPFRLFLLRHLPGTWELTADLISSQKHERNSTRFCFQGQTLWSWSCPFLLDPGILSKTACTETHSESFAYTMCCLVQNHLLERAWLASPSFWDKWKAICIIAFMTAMQAEESFTVMLWPSESVCQSKYPIPSRPLCNIYNEFSRLLYLSTPSMQAAESDL